MNMVEIKKNDRLNITIKKDKQGRGYIALEFGFYISPTENSELYDRYVYSLYSNDMPRYNNSITLEALGDSALFRVGVSFGDGFATLQQLLTPDQIKELGIKIIPAPVEEKSEIAWSESIDER